MNNDELVVLVIKGYISSLADEEAEVIEEGIRRVRTILGEYKPDQQNLIIALIGAEMTKEIG